MEELIGKCPKDILDSRDDFEKCLVSEKIDDSNLKLIEHM